jgi:hypothetical protein
MYAPAPAPVAFSEGRSTPRLSITLYQEPNSPSTAVQSPSLSPLSSPSTDSESLFSADDNGNGAGRMISPVSILQY